MRWTPDASSAGAPGVAGKPRKSKAPTRHTIRESNGDMHCRRLSGSSSLAPAAPEDQSGERGARGAASRRNLLDVIGPGRTQLRVLEGPPPQQKGGLIRHARRSLFEVHARQTFELDRWKHGWNRRAREYGATYAARPVMRSLTSQRRRASSSLHAKLLGARALQSMKYSPLTPSTSGELHR